MTASEELWISRAIDRRAGSEDWRGLHRIAASDPDVWRRVCATLEAETSLTEGLAALLPQDLCTAAAGAPSPSAGAPHAAVASARPGLRMLGLLAATLLVAFVVGRWSVVSAGPAPLQPAASPLVAAGSPDELMQAYLREGATAGRVLDQLPLRTLSTRRASDGNGFEVVFVRSLIECARVQQLMTLAPDEHGSPQPLQIDLANYIPPTDF